jgi:hypothetical protein
MAFHCLKEHLRTNRESSKGDVWHPIQRVRHRRCVSEIEGNLIRPSLPVDRETPRECLAYPQVTDIDGVVSST